MTNFVLFSLKERKIAHKSQQMPFGGVKITKSTIIQQIYQFEVYKLGKLENKVVQTFYDELQPSHISKINFIQPKMVKNADREHKNSSKRGKNHKIANNSANISI